METPSRLAAALRTAADSGDLESLRKGLDEATAIGQLRKVVEMQDSDTDLAPLALAAAAGQAQCVQLLLEARAEPNLASEDSGNRTALHFAAFDGHVEVVRLLIEARADIKADSTGGTAREIAQQRAKEWRIGGGDGEEDIEALSTILDLLGDG
eukprot:TRINITY_DN69246_c0_g1_i1.p1 TRINITY_DN69246_c0_g1~~TRINITY_DN69246_c0_g1_i1.p1  ORF type:complete len:154 (+),score=41.41 TRINITY_DN69246_c0_g1_i1:40-501(+)